MEKPIKTGQCSYYVTNKAMENTLVTIPQFITAIRSDRWKGKAEEFRTLTARGDKRGAKFIKDLFLCFSLFHFPVYIALIILSLAQHFGC